MRFCDLKVEDRRYLERVSMKSSGGCHPSIDVHPDLSASSCLAMRDICAPDVTVIASQDAILRLFVGEGLPIRQASVSRDCLDCRDFMRRRQGGCLALRREKGGQVMVALEASGK